MIFYKNPHLKKYYDSKFIRFLFVGALNSLFGYFVFALFIYIGFHYTLAVFLGTVLGVLFNFQTTGRLVFNSKNNKLIFRFIFVYGILWAVNSSLLYLLLSCGLQNTYIAGLILVPPMGILSFFFMKYCVFRPS